MLCDSRCSGSLVESSLVLTGVGMSRAGPSTLISSADCWCGSCIVGLCSAAPLLLGADLSHSSFGGVSCRKSASASLAGGIDVVGSEDVLLLLLLLLSSTQRCSTTPPRVFSTGRASSARWVGMTTRELSNWPLTSGNKSHSRKLQGEYRTTEHRQEWQQRRWGMVHGREVPRACCSCVEGWVR